MTRFFGLTTFLVVVSVTLSAQVESLRSLARGMGGAAATHVNREIPRWPLDEMVRSAALIVRGRITQQTAFLNDDESLIFTDSWISPSEIFKSAPTIDPAIPIVLRILGGKVRLDGLMMTTTTDVDQVLETGDECFFFLSAAESTPSLRARPGVYDSVTGPFGVFPIGYGSLDRKPVGTSPRGESGAAAFAATIRQLVAADKRHFPRQAMVSVVSPPYV